MNGCFVTGFFMPPLIVTLAMQWIIFGVAYIITNSHSVPVMDDSFRVIGQGYAGKIPVLAWQCWLLQMDRKQPKT